MSRILVFRNGSVGNTLVAVPLLRALHASGAGTAVDVVVDRTAAAVLADCPYVRERILYEKREAGLREHPRLVRRLRAGDYDVAVVHKRFRRNEVLARLSGAPRRVGYRSPGVRPWFLTDVVPYREGRNIVELGLDLLEPLGIPPRGRELEFWWRSEHEREAERILHAAGLVPGGYVVVHPGGTTQAENRIPVRLVAEAMRRVTTGSGLAVLYTFGPDEAALAEELPAAMPRVVGAALGTLAVLLARSRLFVGHDSGPSHLADAVGTPGAIVYTDAPGWEEHLEKWKPVGDSYRVVRRSSVRGPEDLAREVLAALSG